MTETIGFFPIQILIFWMLCNNADARRCSYFELGLPVVEIVIICLIEYTSLEYHKCILLFLTSYWIWHKNGDPYVDLFGLFHWRNNISVNQNEERKGKRTNFDQSFIDMFISIYCGIYCGTRIKGKVPQIVGLTLTWKVVLSWLMTVDGLKPLSQVVCHRGLS